jgi:hypothetical protein
MEKNFKTPGSAVEAQEFVNALMGLGNGSTSAAPVKMGYREFYARIKALSALAVNQAPLAGKSSLDFFPPMPSTAKFATFDGVASQKYMDANYWNDVFSRGEKDTPEKKEYFGVVTKMFTPLGDSVREIMMSLSAN